MLIMGKFFLMKILYCVYGIVKIFWKIGIFIDELLGMFIEVRSWNFRIICCCLL